MPCPSARTKYFLSRTILNLSRTKILSRVKKSIFCFEKSFKIKFLVERTLKIYFQLEIFIMHGFWKQKIDFLTLDKIFVLDNLNIVLDKKNFVWADGRGNSVRILLTSIEDHRQSSSYEWNRRNLSYWRDSQPKVQTQAWLSCLHCTCRVCDQGRNQCSHSRRCSRRLWSALASCAMIRANYQSKPEREIMYLTD